MSCKKIFIVDDHQIVIDGIQLLIEKAAGFEVAGTCSIPSQAMEQILQQPVDIILTDISMPDVSGVELTRMLRRQLPGIKIIALSMFGNTDTISEMIDAGIDGFILKNTGSAELIEALEKVSGGHKYYSADITHQLVKSVKDQKVKEHLTDREIEIIRMIEKEYSNKQIAAELFISERTIETHRKNIFRKTQTQSVVGLIKYAYDRKII